MAPGEVENLLSELGFRVNCEERIQLFKDLVQFHEDPEHPHRKVMTLRPTDHVLNTEFHVFLRKHGERYFGHERQHLKQDAPFFNSQMSTEEVVESFYSLRHVLLYLSYRWRKKKAKEERLHAPELTEDSGNGGSPLTGQSPGSLETRKNDTITRRRSRRKRSRKRVESHRHEEHSDSDKAHESSSESLDLDTSSNDSSREATQNKPWVIRYRVGDELPRGTVLRTKCTFEVKWRKPSSRVGRKGWYIKWKKDGSNTLLPVKKDGKEKKWYLYHLDGSRQHIDKRLDKVTSRPLSYESESGIATSAKPSVPGRTKAGSQKEDSDWNPKTFPDTSPYLSSKPSRQSVRGLGLTGEPHDSSKVTPDDARRLAASTVGEVDKTRFQNAMQVNKEHEVLPFSAHDKNGVVSLIVKLKIGQPHHPTKDPRHDTPRFGTVASARACIDQAPSAHITAVADSPTVKLEHTLDPEHGIPQADGKNLIDLSTDSDPHILTINSAASATKIVNEGSVAQPSVGQLLSKDFVEQASMENLISTTNNNLKRTSHATTVKMHAPEKHSDSKTQHLQLSSANSPVVSSPRNIAKRAGTSVLKTLADQDVSIRQAGLVNEVGIDANTEICNPSQDLLKKDTRHQIVTDSSIGPTSIAGSATDIDVDDDSTASTSINTHKRKRRRLDVSSSTPGGQRESHEEPPSGLRTTSIPKVGSAANQPTSRAKARVEVCIRNRWGGWQEWIHGRLSAYNVQELFERVAYSYNMKPDGISTVKCTFVDVPKLNIVRVLRKDHEDDRKQLMDTLLETLQETKFQGTFHIHMEPAEEVEVIDLEDWDI